MNPEENISMTKEKERAQAAEPLTAEDRFG
jgi:hypothetical protein